MSDDALQNGFCFRVIQGSSGSGKSHYINWVRAQLIRNKSTAHIVWIRKNNSMKVIFQKLFKPFEKNENFLQLVSVANLPLECAEGESPKSINNNALS